MSRKNAWSGITKGERLTAQRNIQCPFYRQWDGHRIICESVVLPGKPRATTEIKLRTALEAKGYIETHCYLIASGTVCPIARVLNQYYRGEEICGKTE